MRILIFTLSFMVFFSCEKKRKTTCKNTSLLKKEMNTFIEDWHKTAATANYEKYFEKMDSLFVFIGTDASEKWNKKEFATFSKPYFDNGKAWNFKTVERTIYSSKNKKMFGR